jgi:hypothetical protein
MLTCGGRTRAGWWDGALAGRRACRAQDLLEEDASKSCFPRHGQNEDVQGAVSDVCGEGHVDGDVWLVLACSEDAVLGGDLDAFCVHAEEPVLQGHIILHVDLRGAVRRLVSKACQRRLAKTQSWAMVTSLWNIVTRYHEGAWAAAHGTNQGQ